MNERKKLQRRPPRSTILIALLLVLGIGCIGWALINITAQPMFAKSVDGGISPSSIAILKQTKQFVLAEDRGEPEEPKISSEIPASQKNLYPLYPTEGDNIGSLIIPVLDQELPIIQGTGSDELEKGVGHFTQSVLPGEEDNCVLSGHRDTVFAELGKLKIGDQLIARTSAGIFTYEVNDIRIVDKDDKTVIVPADHAILTVTTCYPFIYVGSAPNRYIITADLVLSNLTPN